MSLWTRFNSLAALLTGIASVLDLKVAGAFTVCLQFASALPYTLLRNALGARSVCRLTQVFAPVSLRWLPK